jgi:hypothetical protein
MTNEIVKKGKQMKLEWETIENEILIHNENYNSSI